MRHGGPSGRAGTRSRSGTSDDDPRAEVTAVVLFVFVPVVAFVKLELELAALEWDARGLEQAVVFDLPEHVEAEAEAEVEPARNKDREGCFNAKE